MGENKDRRFEIAEEFSYLRGIKLYWKAYAPYSDVWTHDHCEFCFATFSEHDGPNILHHGYSTEDEYRWICKTCFDEFKEFFDWQVEE